MSRSRRSPLGPRARRRSAFRSGGPAASGAVVAVALLVPVALTAANDVASSRAGAHGESITIAEKKPNLCDSIAVTVLLEGSGSVVGGAEAELILGSGIADSIDGAGGDDCLVAGEGGDSLTGGAGTDVCIGGPGADSFDVSCETQVQ